LSIYIAAPFGNYLHFNGIRSVRGSFTVQKRPGLIKQLLKTLRYHDGAWYNKIGLRNPGIDWGIKKYRAERDDVLSLAAIEPGDWEILNKLVPQDMNVELNLSCPNIDHFDNYAEGAESFLNGKRQVIAKLSPHIRATQVQDLLAKGFKSFHCCNTLPTERGGMSGKSLRLYTEQTIDFLLRYSDNPNELEIIAGGGIDSIEDIKSYHYAGATSFSLGTVCFNPLKLNKLIRNIHAEIFFN